MSDTAWPGGMLAFWVSTLWVIVGIRVVLPATIVYGLVLVAMATTRRLRTRGGPSLVPRPTFTKGRIWLLSAAGLFILGAVGLLRWGPQASGFF
jgi:hypothetical protein